MQLNKIMHSDPRKHFQPFFFFCLCFTDAKWLVIQIYLVGTCSAVEIFVLCKTQAFQTIEGVKQF